MIKYIVPVILTLLVLGCGSSQTDDSLSSSDSLNSQYLSIARGPVIGEVFSPAQKVRLEFSAPLDITTVNSNTAYIQQVFNNDGYDSHPLRISSYTGVSSGSSYVYVTPHEYLQSLSSYQIIVTTDVKDIKGRSLAEEYIYSFTTSYASVDNSLLTLRATKPKDSDGSVLVSTEIVLDFSKNLSSYPAYTTENFLTVTDSQTGTEIEGRVEVFNTLLKFIPQNPLPYGSTIDVNLTRSVNDIDYGTSPYYGGANWSFTTRTEANSPKSYLGYKALDTLATNFSSYSVKQLTKDSNSSTIAVARQGGIDIYKVDYHVPKSKPSLIHLSFYPLQDQVTSMVLLGTPDAPSIAVSTNNSGFYHLLLSTSDHKLNEVGHYDLGKNIYKVQVGKVNDYASYPDKIYTVSPQNGLKIYDYNSTSMKITLQDTVSIVGQAIDAIDKTYTNQAGAEVRSIYVANYDGSIVMLNETNVSQATSIDINSSVKVLTYNIEGGSIYKGIQAIGSSGNVESIDFDGVLQNGSEYGLNTTVNDLAYTTGGSQAQLYYATDRGVILMDANGTYLEQQINATKSIASIEIVAPSNEGGSVAESSASFFVSVSSDGVLEVYNALFDDVDPTLSYISTPYTADAPFDIDFNDVYLDHATIDKSDFELIDNNDSTVNPIPFSLNVSADTYSPNLYKLQPDNNLTDGHNYTLTVKATKIKDMIGNPFNGGENNVTSFTAQFQ